MKIGHQQSTEPIIQVASLQLALRSWLNERGLSSVTFKEGANAQDGQYDDYKVVYEARFIPESISQAGLDLMLTDEGLLGVGLETRQRVSERLKVRNHQEGFAAGFEPTRFGMQEALLLLEVVSAGEVIVQARIIPLYGMGRTKASVTSKLEGAAELFKRFYFATSMQSGFCTRTLTFDPWR